MIYGILSWGNEIIKQNNFCENGSWVAPNTEFSLKFKCKFYSHKHLFGQINLLDLKSSLIGAQLHPYVGVSDKHKQFKIHYNNCYKF